MTDTGGFGLVSMRGLKEKLRSSDELALLDVRNEADFAAGQIFGSVSTPLTVVEDMVLDLLPRRSVPIVILDEQPGWAREAAGLLSRLGFTDIALTDGGLAAWVADGGELFTDVNVPSKAFGEWVATFKKTPLMAAEEVARRVGAGEDIVILDARPYDEYSTMSIPGGINAPGAELLARTVAAVKSEETRIIVNCAGRTRSIIGAQSLIDAGIRNPVSALENGTIGWTLAGFDVARGALKAAPAAPEMLLPKLREMAARLADAAGVRTVDAAGLTAMTRDETRTTYLFDVRAPGSDAEGRLSAFALAPGGQLVQALDEYVGVRNARILIVDYDGVRAPMTAAWLRQLGERDIFLIAAAEASHHDPAPLPAPQTADALSTAEAAEWIERGALVVDVTTAKFYEAGHIPEAWFLSRTRLAKDALNLPATSAVIVTSPCGETAAVAAPVLRSLLPEAQVQALHGGTRAWRGEGRPVETSREGCLAASPMNDSYKRPYIGTDNSREAMQAYIDWELQLVGQLQRDRIAKFDLV